MATGFETKPPVWFWIVAVLLLLWECGGVYACVQQFRLGADAMPDVTDYDRTLYASMPVWYNWVYAVATGTGALAALMLLLRKAVAKPLYIVSTVAVVIMFGYLFATTDIVAVKGASTALFPLFIFALSLFGIWLADKAVKRGWAN